MATIGKRKIHTFGTINPGSTVSVTWNAPADTVLSYFAYPVVPTPSGQHGSARGTVEVTRVTCFHLRDNYDSDKLQTKIYVKNVGDSPCGADLWQSWIE
jgi:hypothetical protein